MEVTDLTYLSDPLESAHDGMVVVDSQGVVVVFNRAARQAAGFGKEALTGRGLEEIAPHAWTFVRELLATASLKSA